MVNQCRSLIVIPTYNEAENLERLIQEIFTLPIHFNILVVDDNSPDGTGDIAERITKERSDVYVLHRSEKTGLGPAYIAGFRWALEHDYTYILSMDCDFSHHPRYLPTFIERISDADLVIGSRYVPQGGTKNWRFIRKLISRGGNLFAKSMLRLKTYDCTGAFRCYQRKMIEQIPWESIQVHGYGFCIGAIYYVEQLGGRILEFPITFEDRRVGKSKMSLSIVIEAFSFVIKLALRNGRAKNKSNVN